MAKTRRVGTGSETTTRDGILPQPGVVIEESVGEAEIETDVTVEDVEEAPAPAPKKARRR